MSNGDEGNPRLHNMLAELLSQMHKLLEITESWSRDNHARAKGAYDTHMEVENKVNYLVSEQRVHRNEIDTALEKSHAAILVTVDKIHELFVKIATSTAIASNDAGDAKNAAIAAREATGQHRLLDEFGHPTNEARVGGRVEKDTPTSFAGVAKELVKGLPWPARLALAFLALLGTLFGGQAIEARWKLLGGVRETTVEHAPKEAHHKD